MIRPPRWYGPEQIAQLGHDGARYAISEALSRPPVDDPRRDVVTVANGQLLIMPAAADGFASVKVVSVAPANAARGLPRIQGVFILFDATSLTPVALLDGAALTALRTPAVSVAALTRVLERHTEPLRVVIIGGGPQGRGHVAAMQSAFAERPGIRSLVVATRRPVRTPPDIESCIIGSEEFRAFIASADVVLCATDSAEPLFDSNMLPHDAVVVAIGSHEPHRSEVDTAFCRRATVIVEDVQNALTECGEVVRAVEEGALEPGALVPMRSLFRAEGPALGDAVLIKTAGMAWQDLVVGAAVVQIDM